MKNSNVTVSIVMGSKSDLELMKKAGNLLDKIDIGYEYFISSIHRMPERTIEYIKKLGRGNIKVVITAAGMANHLSGITASMTLIPVIAVPVSSTLGGVDALLSTIQMPPGTPVAAVSVDGAVNAALLAARILAVSDDSIKKRLIKYMELRKADYIKNSEIF
ncbi:MAG: 5-(carboxyamino)imidazole ribonucleotide mutase [Epsilonproteobacteria bacterium]|nr:5-(carboxyamino)imidazole ribonucleotide mutase [Campylobacterota bacterium]